MIKLWYVYVNLDEQSFLSKHVRKNEAPLIADFVLDLFFNSGTYILYPQNKKGNTKTRFAVSSQGHRPQAPPKRASTGSFFG